MEKIRCTWQLFGLFMGLNALLISACTPTKTMDTQSHGVYFHQMEVERVYAGIDIDPDNTSSVFAHVFNALPDKVVIYPTENYYYFRFFSNGTPFHGNLRLDVIERQQGKIHFAYFIPRLPWLQGDFTRYKVFSASDGVKISQTSSNAYHVSYNKKTVEFLTSPVEHSKLPEGAVLADEVLVGAMMDDSAIPFFYIFQQGHKLFLYILNHDRYPAEWLKALPGFDQLYMDQRSGFVFYRDKNGPRFILVAVYRGNIDENNYFDGPFDQLPDYAIKDDSYKNYLEDAYPSLNGLIDRYGNFLDGRGRVLINPYLDYYSLPELSIFSKCKSFGAASREFYECLSPNH